MKKPETIYFRLFSNYFHFYTPSVLHAPCDVKNFFSLVQKTQKSPLVLWYLGLKRGRKYAGGTHRAAAAAVEAVAA